MLKSLADTLGKKYRLRYLAAQGEVQAEKLLDVVADMLAEVKADNFLRHSV